MADEELAVAESGVQDAPTGGEQQQVETPDIDLETGEEGEGQNADDLDDVEYDGKSYRLPKELKGALLRNADYTQKTQQVSERTRALEAQAAAIEERAKITDEELDARASLKSVTAEIDRFKDFDWNAYQMARQTDPFAADEAWNYAQHLRTQKAELEGTIGKAQTYRTEKAQQELAKRVQDTNAWAAKEIPGWKPELTATLVTLAEQIGVPEQTLKANWSPSLYKLLHRAHLGDQLLKKQSAPRPATADAPPEPLRTVSGKGSPAPAGLSDRLSPEEWVKRRNAQVRSKRA